MIFRVTLIPHATWAKTAGKRNAWDQGGREALLQIQAHEAQAPCASLISPLMHSWCCLPRAPTCVRKLTGNMTCGVQGEAVIFLGLLRETLTRSRTRMRVVEIAYPSLQPLA
jgi:hypothetical protein